MSALGSIAEDSSSMEVSPSINIPSPPLVPQSKPKAPPPVAKSAVQAVEIQAQLLQSGLPQAGMDASTLYRVSKLLRHSMQHGAQSIGLNRPSQTWHRAARLIRQSLNFRENATEVFDTSLPLQQRVNALQRLEERLAIDPSRKYLAAALRKKQEGAYASFGDKLLTEVYITSETVFDFLTPPKYERHVILTPVICMLCIIAFLYMAGANLPYLEHTQETSCQKPDQLYAPGAVVRWMVGDFSKTWCLPGNAWQFSQGYLALWGGRYTPLMRRRWYTFLTSAFVHRSFLHVLSNLVLFSMLASEIERRYGQMRFLFLWVSSTVGASLFSAVCEHNCNVVCGLSGSCFGMIALYALDVWSGRKKRQVLILRVSGLVAALCVLFLGYIMTPQAFSHISHVGGALFGVLPALLFQEHITKHERIEAWLPAVAAVVLGSLFAILFGVFYAHTITHTTCGTLL